MITYGQYAQPGRRWLSLGAIATGNAHTFTRFRTGANGASLHPLQRTGQVSADSHSMLPRMSATAQPGLGDSVYPAAYFDMRLPPVVSVYGGPNDPAMQI